jgi:hypothetical protein
MIFSKLKLILTVNAIIIAGMVVFVPILWAGSQPLTWNLHNGRVVQYGTTMEIAEGSLTTGYTIEALALREGSTSADEKFLLTLTVFSPRQDRLGQKAGRWYLRGSWSITEEQAKPEERRTRYGPGEAKGTLTAELSFNPITEAGIIHGRIRMSRLARAGGNGAGTFQGNQLFEGKLSISLPSKDHKER